MHNSVVIYSAYGSQGFPLVFLKHYRNGTRLLTPYLVLNLIAWSAMLFGVWYVAGRYTEKSAPPHDDEA